MRSSLILAVTLLLAIASVSIVQARPGKSECTCGSLGSGINPCKCGEVVVKAARLQKPLYHASLEAINEAAAAREVAERMSVGTITKSVTTFPGQSTCGGGIYGTSGGFSRSSGTSGSTSSLSSVGVFGKLIGSGLSSVPQGPISEPGCGCGRKSAPLEARDLLSPNTHGKVVPRFPPIGDLCYPNKQTSRLDVTTKVTPAYPAKLKCSCSSSPYEGCLNVVNSQVDRDGLERLGLVNTHSATGAIGRLGLFDGRVSGSYGTSSSLGGYTSSAASSNTLGGYSSLRGYDGLTAGLAGGSFGGYGSSASLAGSSFGGSGSSYSFGSAGAGSTAGYYGTGRTGLGGFYGSSTGLGGATEVYDLAGSYAGSSTSGLTQLSSGASGFGGYGISSGLGATSGGAEMIQGFAGSDCGDSLELPEDYSYPRLPADPVSLTLAYKSLFPHTVVYNKKGFVPEDKLAFGHRTLPSELAPSMNTPDVPEEKLQIVDKPVVELKPAAPIPVTIGVYDEHEEAKLAELEAIERERIKQEAIAGQTQTNFITYGDLGYAPIDGVLSGRLPRPGMLQVGAVEEEDSVVGGGCGPVGPPAPGYVPGSVVIQRETVETDGEVERERSSEGAYSRHYLDEMEDSDEEDDDTDYASSGLFARLRSAARNYGPAACPQ